MQAVHETGTFELIAQAQVTLAEARRAAEDLNQARTDLEETLSYYRWLRFLGYDPQTLDFLDHLDMRR